MYSFIARIILMLVVVVCGVQFASAADDDGSFVVVIDPGHGGKDIGAPGKYSHESDIVYDVSKRLQKLINEEHPEVKVILTHNNDKYIKLAKRGQIANDANADVFISIHTNSIDRSSRGRNTINGAEVYTLGLEKTEASLSVTQRENAVFEVEGETDGAYQDYDPESPESQIIFEMYQNLNHHRAVELAENIQKELVGVAGRADRGVRQANLGVLRSISMPGVLVELDFICNPTIEKLFNTDKGKNMFARALANGFSKYYAHHGNHGSPKPISAREKTKDNEEAFYTVQIFASPEKLAADDAQIRKVKDVDFYEHEGLYKYICGRYASLEQAEKHLRTIRKTYPEAFIIKMRNGKRIMQYYLK